AAAAAIATAAPAAADPINFVAGTVQFVLTSTPNPNGTASATINFNNAQATFMNTGALAVPFQMQFNGATIISGPFTPGDPSQPTLYGLQNSAVANGASL